VHVVTAPPLEGEGAWRRAELALGALLPPGPVEALLVGRDDEVGWRERGLSAAQGLALDDLWLGPAWPARGGARVRPRAVDPSASSSHPSAPSARCCTCERATRRAAGARRCTGRAGSTARRPRCSIRGRRRARPQGTCGSR